MHGSTGGPRETALRIFNGLAPTYDPVLDFTTLLQDRSWKRWAVARLPLAVDSDILDIGFGTGVLEEGLRTRCRFVGVDITEPMLRRAQRKRLPSVTSLVLGDGEKLPFADATFDAIVSCYVVKYCSRKRLSDEAFRILRPGGRFVLYDFVKPRGPLWPLNSAYTFGFLRVFGRALELTGSPSAYTFTALPRIIAERPWDAGFKGFLEGVGFARVEEKLLSGGVTIGYCATKPATGEPAPSWPVHRPRLP